MLGYKVLGRNDVFLRFRKPGVDVGRAELMTRPEHRSLQLIGQFCHPTQGGNDKVFVNGRHFVGVTPFPAQRCNSILVEYCC
jgi:hypothetical protein